MERKAVALLSGGLDSTLAVKIMLELGVEMVALNFITPFCCCTRRDAGCKHQASQVAQQFGIPIKVLSKGREYLEVVRHPRYGYGKNLNPCIDCRIFMHRAAGESMREIGASFLVTGEVLGQRPKSQRLDALHIIDRDSGLKGRVLRPLSAQLLPPTLPEVEGLIDRESLLAMSGRSRKPQISLAETYGITDYPCPAGGCLLTDKGFAQRLRDLFDHSADLPDLRAVQFLKVGRHFRLSPGAKVVVGRNQEENEKLSRMVGDDHYSLKTLRWSGPLTLALGFPTEEDLIQAARITARYSSAPPQEMVEVAFRHPALGHEGRLCVQGIGEEVLEALRL
ncbi:MAG: hypothetical protein HYY20_11020 [Candidatus Tectomicrobia bacterium]|uniref:Thil AANH domain-containing protein n=1 Tax=Tectimicrobiota bacterium TaxID=2528274 RepID=A0A932CQ34_UNCTE|nr:hypothetical protein [Candidatus Tectomicrobia bacterium]